MRLYVPAGGDDLRRLERDGRLDGGGVRALAVTPWAQAELAVDDAEDEEAEYAVLAAAAEEQPDAPAPVAVLVFDLPGADLPSDGLRVTVDHDLVRRRLVAVHVLPDLDWYAGHELPDVVAALG
jgi:hypothetical protein